MRGIHRAFVLGLCAVCIGAGCGEVATDSGETDAVTDPLAAIDPAALATAAGNQAKLEASGLRLLGRAWYAPDAYGEVYAIDAEPTDIAPTAEEVLTAPSTQAVFFSVRATSELATRWDLRPLPDESFEEYVERTASGPVAIRFDASTRQASETGKDVMLFQPSSGDPGIRMSSLVNEYCPKAIYDFLCGGSPGYHASDVLVSQWNYLDRSSASITATGTTAYGVVCADRADATLTMKRDGTVAWAVDVPQGYVSSYTLDAGWSNWRYCSSHFVVVCTAHRWMLQFNDDSYSVAMTSRGNAHFCGSIRKGLDDDSRFECRALRVCPYLSWE